MIARDPSRSRDRHRIPAVGEPVLNEQRLFEQAGERDRGDCEVQRSQPQCSHADDAGDRDRREGRQRKDERHREAQLRAEDPRERSADAGERPGHQRDLTRPSGQDDERQAEQRVDQRPAGDERPEPRQPEHDEPEHGRAGEPRARRAQRHRLPLPCERALVALERARFLLGDEPPFDAREQKDDDQAGRQHAA